MIPTLFLLVSPRKAVLCFIFLEFHFYHPFNNVDIDSVCLTFNLRPTCQWPPWCLSQCPEHSWVWAEKAALVWSRHQLGDSRIQGLLLVYFPVFFTKKNILSHFCHNLHYVISHTMCCAWVWLTLSVFLWMIHDQRPVTTSSLLCQKEGKGRKQWGGGAKGRSVKGSLAG